MHSPTRLLLALALLHAGVACKDKKDDKPPAAPAAQPVEPGSAAPTGAGTAPSPTIALQAGESFEPGADLVLAGTNPFIWSATPTERVAVGFVFKGEVARAVAAVAGGAPVELGQVEFNPAYSGAFGATTTKDGKAVLVLSSSGGSDDPGFTAAWRLSWDPAAKRPVVEEKGNWGGEEFDKIPPWATLEPAPAGANPPR